MMQVVKIKTTDIENLMTTTFLLLQIPHRTTFMTTLLTATANSHGCKKQLTHCLQGRDLLLTENVETILTQIHPCGVHLKWESQNKT